MGGDSCWQPDGRRPNLDDNSKIGRARDRRERL